MSLEGASSVESSKQPKFGRIVLKRWLLRPSFWTFVVTIIAYWDDRALHGAFVYDDAGSVKSNVVVNGQVPWTDVFRRDYWGTLMSQPQSHKSFRPITTLTFKLNWILSEKYFKTLDTDQHTFGFHLVNLALHGIDTALVTEVTRFVFETCTTRPQHLYIIQLFTGFLFGLHPVHVEAVTNITSRGELLMTFFFLTAFLSYVHGIRSKRWYSVLLVYLIPWLCMTMSVFSKEQGATALVTAVLFDFIVHFESVKLYFFMLFHKRDKSAVSFLIRTMVLAIQTVIICGLRYWLNGESSPDFIFDQNPAAFSEDRFTRVFSVCWVYCLYIFDAIAPIRLCPDWSGKSIDLIHDVADVRIVGVIALWLFAAACLLSLIVGIPSQERWKDTRKVFLVSFFAFLFSPFLLSSNLLVVVGLMKADRVIYLPLLGLCLIEALLLKLLVLEGNQSRAPRPAFSLASKRHLCGYLLVLTQLGFYCGKLHERNIAWSHSLNLWVSAFELNPRSSHTRYNCGYELSLARRFKESEQVLSPIADPHTEGPSNTFVYAMVLFNLNKCSEARGYIDEALDVVAERRKSGGVRDTQTSLARLESNLYVAKAYCEEDTSRAGHIMYKAVQTDPTNQYAIDQAKAMVQRIQQLEKINEKKKELGLA